MVLFFVTFCRSVDGHKSGSDACRIESVHPVRTTLLPSKHTRKLYLPGGWSRCLALGHCALDIHYLAVDLVFLRQNLVQN